MGTQPDTQQQSYQPMTMEDLAAQVLPPRVADELHLIEAQEVKTWPMRWTFLIIMISLLTIVIVATIAATVILFLLTRNQLTLLPFTAILACIFAMTRYIAKFLFWRDSDYRLAEKKLDIKIKKLEMKQENKRSKA